jgi:hypothetical protein
VTFIGDKDVFGFEFPVDDAVTMENFNPNNYFSYKMFDNVLFKHIFFSAEVIIDITTL